MDALRNSKKISLLAVAILFLYILFTLILDAPRTYCYILLFFCLCLSVPYLFYRLGWSFLQYSSAKWRLSSRRKSKNSWKSPSLPLFRQQSQYFCTFVFFQKKLPHLSTSGVWIQRKKMFGQSAFGSTAPTFGAASAAPTFGAAGAAGGGTGGMFGQTAAGGAFGAQKPAFGAGTTFGGATGRGTEWETVNCGFRIRFFFPSRILDTGSELFPIPDPGSALKNLSNFDPKIVSKLSEIWSGLYPSRIPDPGVKKTPDPGSWIRVRNTGEK